MLKWKKIEAWYLSLDYLDSRSLFVLLALGGGALIKYGRPNWLAKPLGWAIGAVVILGFAANTFFWVYRWFYRGRSKIAQILITILQLVIFILLILYSRSLGSASR